MPTIELNTKTLMWVIKVLFGVVITIAGWYGQGVLNDIRDGQTKTNAVVEELVEGQQEIEKDLIRQSGVSARILDKVDDTREDVKEIKETMK